MEIFVSNIHYEFNHILGKLSRRDNAILFILKSSAELQQKSVRKILKFIIMETHDVLFEIENKL